MSDDSHSKRNHMKRTILIVLVLLGCGTTKDSGCGGVNNSTTAEQFIRKQFPEAAKVTCITDDSDHMYLCTVHDGKERDNFRCADSADSSSADKVKCIPWFATE